MQDFWQILGRAIADEDFRKTVAAATKGKRCGVTKSGHGLEMDGAELVALRTAIDPKIEGPISMFALGETMRIGTGTTKNGAGKLDFLKSVKKVGDTVKPILGSSTQPARKEFYMTLGAMIGSETLRNTVATPGGGVPADYSAGGEDKLLVAIARSVDFQKAATAYCEDAWTPICFIGADFYLNHLHPHVTLG